MPHWYHQELQRMKQDEQEQRRGRKERILFLFVLVNVAWILTLSGSIVGYHLYRMFMQR